MLMFFKKYKLDLLDSRYCPFMAEISWIAAIVYETESYLSTSGFLMKQNWPQRMTGFCS